MKADKMDVADYLSDETFINYCRQSSETDVAYWEHYIVQHPDEQFVIAQAVEQYLELFNAVAQQDCEEQVSLLEGRLKVAEQPEIIETEAAIGQKLWSNRTRLLRFSAAAAVLLMIAFYSIRYLNTNDNPIKTFVAAYGERKNIQLPDGSLVVLNGGSSIELRKGFGEIGRDVYLQGEAFFDVRHNAQLPFIVHTTMMDVKALGTAFNVKAYGDDLVTETSLIRGLVEVTLKENDNQLMLLHPNEKIQWQHGASVALTAASQDDTTAIASVGKAGLLMKIVATNRGEIREIAWKENKLIFDDELFGDIALLLERWYGAKFKFNNESLKNYRFTGSFEKEDLNTVLGLLQETSSFKYTIVPGDTLIVNLSK